MTWSQDGKEERGSLADNWGKSISGRGNSDERGPEVGTSLEHLRPSEEASRAAAQGVEGNGRGR